ncbi:hypothetical protein BGW80DRAFT_1447493 [Lactifluus volemus]|nr:hypothetical protein BGW80DRAFT_1447493 [Lactifluus volemus]
MCRSRNVDGDRTEPHVSQQIRVGAITGNNIQLHVEWGEWLSVEKNSERANRHVVLPLSIVRYGSRTIPSHFPSQFWSTPSTFIRPVQCPFFSNTRPFLLPHDLPIPNTTTETTRGIITIEASHRESLNEVASPQRLGSFGLPRCESPDDYWPEPNPASEMSSRAKTLSERNWFVAVCCDGRSTLMWIIIGQAQSFPVQRKHRTPGYSSSGMKKRKKR